MKVGILAITAGGGKLAGTIAAGLKNSHIVDNEGGIAATLAENWHHYQGFVCIMAAGIVVRAIAPLLGDKRSDPAVVVVDEKGLHAVSLLSGHLGGGNSLADRVCKITGGKAVITTASDILELVPLDLWAKVQQLVPASSSVMTAASSLLVNQGYLRLYSEIEVEELPPGLRRVASVKKSDLTISLSPPAQDQLVLHPRILVVGIGCNRGTPLDEFEEALRDLFNQCGLPVQAIRNLASIDAKNDEQYLLQFARQHDWRIDFFSRQEINAVTGIDVSQAALKAVGAIGVAEPAALLSAQTSHLLIRKHKWQNITMAVARAPSSLSAQVLDPSDT